MPSQTALKLEWLKLVRAAVAEAVQRMEDGIHLLNGAGDEHMRDAAEAALERTRVSRQVDTAHRGGRRSTWLRDWLSGDHEQWEVILPPPAPTTGTWGVLNNGFRHSRGLTTFATDAGV